MDDENGLYLGLISGTSADGVDAVLARFSPRLEVVHANTFDWPDALRKDVLALARDDATIRLDDLGTLDVRLGRHFADVALALLAEARVPASVVRAIGSHGQTVCHRPLTEPPFTMQLGDPSVIAERSGIDVVADFRRADVAAGGQGAPLAPIVHQALLGGDDAERAVLNLGGIANVTVLSPNQPVRGFDTGPANGLMDAWVQRCRGTPRDDNGTWAASGRVDEALLARLLDDAYFRAAPPKSTGREYFHLDWLQRHDIEGIAPADVQATLLMLTVRSVAEAIHRHAPAARDVLVCGGGVHNATLMHALTDALPDRHVGSTAGQGIDPDFVEGIAFAWLARQRLLGRPGNLPEVTGARGARVLGALVSAPRL